MIEIPIVTGNTSFNIKGKKFKIDNRWIIFGLVLLFFIVFIDYILTALLLLLIVWVVYMLMNWYRKREEDEKE